MTLTRITLEPDLVERVYDALLHSITEGTLAPGTRLAQEDLAAQLNVSRQPVLQALRLLKKDGFVVDAGKRGVMVTSIDAKSIAQVYQLRGALDALASRLAAERKAVIDPRPDRTRLQGGARAQHCCTGRNGHRVPQRHLRGERQYIDRRIRQSPLGAYPPRHEQCVVRRGRARIGVG